MINDLIQMLLEDLTARDYARNRPKKYRIYSSLDEEVL